MNISNSIIRKLKISKLLNDVIVFTYEERFIMSIVKYFENLDSFEYEYTTPSSITYYMKNGALIAQFININNNTTLGIKSFDIFEMIKSYIFSNRIEYPYGIGAYKSPPNTQFINECGLLDILKYLKLIDQKYMKLTFITYRPENNKEIEELYDKIQKDKILS